MPLKFFFEGSFSSFPRSVQVHRLRWDGMINLHVVSASTNMDVHYVSNAWSLYPCRYNVLYLPIAQRSNLHTENISIICATYNYVGQDERRISSFCILRSEATSTSCPVTMYSHRVMHRVGTVHNNYNTVMSLHCAHG